MVNKATLDAEADKYLTQVYMDVGIAGTSDQAKYDHLSQIVERLAELNRTSSIDKKTTGTISERLCKLGLYPLTTAGFAPLRKFGKGWGWLGDFLLPGHPYDVAVSVKSYSAKERLLASGTGSLLTPTIGWGLFERTSEWSENRTISYLYRGFLAIYMPSRTLISLTPAARHIMNNNGKPLLRNVDEFPADLGNAIHRSHPDRLDIRKI